MPIEPVSGALSVIGVKLAYDVLGPTAKYLGTEVKGLATIGVDNVKRVFEEAKAKKDGLKIKGGAVPPRLLLPMLQSAYFSEDEVVSSYLGGVLCSSLSSTPKDDRSISMVRMIDNLSTYALRAHCIVYASLQRQSKIKADQIHRWLQNHGVTIVFDEATFRSKMKFSPEEDADAIMEHVFITLGAHNLTSEGTRVVSDKPPHRWLYPTLRGVELFSWGCGFGRLGMGPYFGGLNVTGEASSFAVDLVEINLGKASYG